ncbi:glycosyltransferase [Coprococcus catus]|uniref:glycosyltransferase n=1 Tax=Coprococcus catus TaxID=116085 RepID=UPI001C8CE4DA|nr:glycosyltransferase [Coprococcus catus]MBX9229542.1 glycosyltransferase [Coprococcus catus]MCT6800971.1 glycosyltransferase [Coprococcus catus]
MHTKVSVIIPIYNVEKYLYQCLRSVLDQTLSELEIICINDGSSDSSGKILNYLKEKDSRIHIIENLNYGYGHAMNEGLHLATGEYIAIVEPDDFIKRPMLEYLYDIAKIYDADIVKSDFYRFRTKNGKIAKAYQSVAEDDSFYHRLIIPEEERICFRFLMNIWCGIYKRTMIEENNIRFNESPGASFQDNGFWFQTMCFCRSIMYVNVPFYMNRRDNPQSSVNNPNNLYCANEEYRFIRNLIRGNKRMEKFIDAYAIKKYQTYKFNLNRATSENIDQYKECIKREWRQDYEIGDIKESYFLPNEWLEIQQLIEEERYHDSRLKNIIKKIRGR